MPTVVIADDSPTLRRIVTSVLTREGFEVIAVEDGVEAVQGQTRRRDGRGHGGLLFGGRGGAAGRSGRADRRHGGAELGDLGVGHGRGDRTGRRFRRGEDGEARL